MVTALDEDALGADAEKDIAFVPGTMVWSSSLEQDAKSNGTNRPVRRNEVFMSYFFIVYFRTVYDINKYKA